MKWPKNCWMKLGLIVFGLGVVGAGVVVSGVVPVAASSGHFAITKWFLKFSMKRSVATHSLGIEVPQLEDDRLILLGAGHYESGCRFCHGAPGIAPPAVASAATPRAPRLDQARRNYDPEELFYIVRHGIKFTGMPAWPSSVRDDEVWAIVAFLEAFPQFDRRRYEGLVFGSTRGQQLDGAPRTLAQCSRCHGTRGQGRGQAFPLLAAQNARYLEASLQSYAEGKRPSGIMEQVADLSPQERSELAEWFAKQPIPAPKGSTHPTDPKFLAGRKIAQEGIPQRNVPSCEDCHGPRATTRKAYPVLSGQPPAYLERQLLLFAEGHRGGSPFAQLMRAANAHSLKEKEIAAVAAYYSSLSVEQLGMTRKPSEP